LPVGHIGLSHGVDGGLKTAGFFAHRTGRADRDRGDPDHGHRQEDSHQRHHETQAVEPARAILRRHDQKEQTYSRQPQKAEHDRDDLGS